jgi:peptide methionine sulfoxide reductase msrA/msrB
MNGKWTYWVGAVLVVCAAAWTGSAKEEQMKYKKLTAEEKRVIVDKGTEPAFSGMYNDFKGKGTYTCKRCRAALYRSEAKFDSHTGWPSFDDEIEGAVERRQEPDGRRTEILCANCGAHLGHVFTGEGFTSKDVRHCVNSIALQFVADEEAKGRKAYFAGGCFWGVEYFLENAKGVISTRVGFMGGDTEKPSYREVCAGTTGHVETVEVVYDPSKTSYEELARLYFEIHDPTQKGRQGPDIGEQYSSVVFYASEEEREAAEKLIELLKKKGFDIATRLERAGGFWEAEEYHQHYYDKTGKTPYCHAYVKRF